MLPTFDLPDPVETVDHDPRDFIVETEHRSGGLWLAVIVLAFVAIVVAFALLGGGGEAAGDPATPATVTTVAPLR